MTFCSPPLKLTSRVFFPASTPTSTPGSAPARSSIPRLGSAISGPSAGRRLAGGLGWLRPIGRGGQRLQSAREDEGEGLCDALELVSLSLSQISPWIGGPRTNGIQTQSSTHHTAASISRKGKRKRSLSLSLYYASLLCSRLTLLPQLSNRTRYTAGNDIATPSDGSHGPRARLQQV